jgi:O-methyltransferase involved in polyketide biosynthesis
MITAVMKNKVEINETALDGPNIKNVFNRALWVAYYRTIEIRRRDALFHDTYARALADEGGENIEVDLPGILDEATHTTMRSPPKKGGVMH